MIGRRGAVIGGLATLTSGCSPAALLNATVPRTGYTLEADLPPEPDHPVGFAQADYLKILLFRAR